MQKKKNHEVQLKVSLHSVEAIGKFKKNYIKSPAHELVHAQYRKCFRWTMTPYWLTNYRLSLSMWYHGLLETSRPRWYIYKKLGHSLSKTSAILCIKHMSKYRSMAKFMVYRTHRLLKLRTVNSHVRGYELG